MDNLLNDFHRVTENPEEFLTEKSNKIKNIQILLKNIYDYGKQVEEKRKRDRALPQLLLQDMDDEQIWQQIELQNNSNFNANLKKISTVLSVNDSKLKFNYNTNQDNDDVEQESDENNSDDNENVEDEEENHFTNNKKKLPKRDTKNKNPARRSSIDDDFFNLDEMDDFLEAEEKKEMKYMNGNKKSNFSDIDFFEANSDSDDNEVEDMHYSSFFEQKDNEEDEEDEDEHEEDNYDHEEAEKEVYDEDMEDKEDKESDDEADNKTEGNKKSVQFNLSKNRTWKLLPKDYDPNKNYEDYNEEVEQIEMQLNEENEEPDQGKSTLEIRQERLKQKIEQLEGKVLEDKPWQLRGEVNAESRPHNSLLEEILEFDSTIRPAPLITEETTQRLEDIIIQRIKDKAFDDVERKIKPVNNPREYRKEIVLNQEKSKESLAQIYEKEFLQKTGQEGDKDEEEPKEHKEIKKQLNILCMKLDALSNYHFTPKIARPEIKIITNTPAIVMEEVAPISVSDRALLAPEEIKNRSKGDIMSKEERTKTDKKRERRHKKVFQKNKQKRADERDRQNESKGILPKSKDLKKKLLDKVVKSRNVEKMVENGDSKALKSSTAFFSQLQDNSSKTPKNNPKKFKENKLSAIRVKL